MLLAALGRRLLGIRDTPRKHAETFRSAWEKLADELRIWLSWEVGNDNTLLGPHQHELYRDHRRSVLEAYVRVQDDFHRFLNQTSGMDLREPLSVEISPSDVVQEEIQEPFERLWVHDNLPATMRWVGEMTPNGFAAWIGRRSDALNTFVAWMGDR
jgi:hypothetical protein